MIRGLPMRRVLPAALAQLAVLAMIAALAPGCARRESSLRAVTAHWVVGRSRPEFDPDGPPDPVRWSLERLLTRSLVYEDSSGRIVPDAAERFSVSSDQLSWTFVLRGNLRFGDGTGCTSRDFREALLAGLNRTDHANRLWLLSAVRGSPSVRAGRPLPALGIETPDPHTLIIQLARPDSMLPAKLSLPGVSAAWRSRTAANDWMGVQGLGPYRVTGAESSRMHLVRRGIPGPEAPDTLMIRFIPSASRVRAMLRAGRVDLVWPRPPGLDAIPAGYQEREQSARPARWLWLLMRADVPPTSKLAARHALAHALHRGEINMSLGPSARPGDPWLAGAAAFNFPKLDAAEVMAWLDRAGLGRSFHVTLAYDSEGPAAAVARVMQGFASRLNIYIELKPLRDGAMGKEALTGSTQLVLAEAQPALETPTAQLAQLVMPLRGPAVGGFRTGWRTREFDPWLTPRSAPLRFEPGRVAVRLEEEFVALPVAALPWEWVARSDGPTVRLHPRYGPEFSIRHDPPGGTLSH